LGRFSGEDAVTSRDAARLLRLPLYPQLSDGEVDEGIRAVTEFLQGTGYAA
jgi:dTDP-4-amino-4,6-dideoxygalactose transaminase